MEGGGGLENWPKSHPSTHFSPLAQPPGLSGCSCMDHRCKCCGDVLARCPGLHPQRTTPFGAQGVGVIGLQGQWLSQMLHVGGPAAPSPLWPTRQPSLPLRAPHPTDALEGKGPQRRPHKRLGRRLEEVAKAVGAGYCWLQMPSRLPLGVRETAAGHRLGALDRRGGGGGGGLPHTPGPSTPTRTGPHALAMLHHASAPALWHRGTSHRQCDQTTQASLAPPCAHAETQAEVPLPPCADRATQTVALLSYPEPLLDNALVSWWQLKVADACTQTGFTEEVWYGGPCLWPHPFPRGARVEMGRWCPESAPPLPGKRTPPRSKW